MRKTVVFVLAFCIIAAPLFASEIGAIIINPAHGGRDPGAARTHTINGERVTYLEKDITLGIALSLREKLSKLFPDVNVVLTRENDAGSTLEEVAKLANAAQSAAKGTALFISIHANLSFNTSTRGYEFFVSGNDTEGLNFAGKVGAGFAEVFGNELPNRGIRQEPYYLVENVFMPAIIAEIGFISNAEDVLLLYSEQGLEKCSTAIANGIAAYIASL